MTAEKFTRKKVGSMTLGERFRKIRGDRRISLGEVSRSTQIQVKYLEAIENGEYEKLPAEVYVRGFLRSYASFLSVPEEAILRLYERERNIQKHLGHVAPFRFQPASPVRFGLSFSPRAVLAAVAAVVAVGFFSYLYLELRSFVSEPRLVIESPMDGAVVGDEAVVRGKADPRAVVLINGEETVVDEDGGFAERLALTAGLNVISVSATNRFGKERERTVSVTVEAPEIPVADFPETGADAPADVAVSVSLRIVSDVTLSVVSDGETVWNGELPAGEERTFTASGRIDVSADPGDAVAVRPGDEPEEPLFQGGGPARVSFGPDGRMADADAPPEADEDGTAAVFDGI